MTSESDRNILDSIFNPFLPLGENLPDENVSTDIDEDFENDPANAQLVKEIEVQGVENAESGNFDKSIQLFTEAINLSPSRSSCYNNRAQAFRLKGDNAAAMEDLNRAINLCRGRGTVARQALCQRGVLHQLDGHSEEALKDYEAAAKLGSDFAKVMAVQLNPYAALCNQMLSQVMEKLQKGETIE